MEQREGYKKTKIGWIPEDWDICKISDLTLEHKQGYYTKDEYSGHGRYLIRITDLKNPVVDFTEMPQLPIDEKTYQQFKVEPGDFLFARSGAIGRYGILNDEHPEAVFASYIIRFRFDKNKVLNKYVGSFYESKFCLRQILSITQGSSNININANNIKSLNLPLPPLPEQKKIASILTTVDDKILSIENQIQQTEQLKKGLMEKLLTEGIGHTEFKDKKIGRAPKSWEFVKLGDITSKVGSGITPRGGSKVYLDSGVPFFRSQNILHGKLSVKVIVYISENQHEKMKNTQLETNDVLLNITGASIGRCCMFSSHFKSGNVNQHVCIIRTNQIILPHYLCYILNSNIGQKQIWNFQAGGNREGLNFQQIKSFNIPLPPLEEQKQITSILSTVDNKIEVLTQKKDQYQTLKKGLSQQLLTGQMRVKV